MLSIRPKLFDNKLPAHHPLRFTQGYGIYQIFIIRKYVYFIAKENSLEFLKAFHYREKLFISLNVIKLWLDQYYENKGNGFVVLTDNSR